MTRPLPLSLSRCAILVLILLAFGLRIWRLANVPPGWRDDELINSLVISQKVLDGDLAVYYPDASGHEALYHVFNAGMLALFGPNFLGIRLLSAFLGMLAVPAVYVVGRRLGGTAVGLTAAAGLTFSFWSLMYSRFGLRHIMLPFLALLALLFFWELFFTKPKSTLRKPLLAALFLSLGFYTYFAGRGLPLIFLAFIIYVWLIDRDRIQQSWRQLFLVAAAAVVLALPLMIVLGRQPETDARVAEVAVPLREARQGNFEPLIRHVWVTLNMFHSDGDDELLYNIAHRPVFSLIGAVFFWLGVVLALWQALVPIGYLLARRGGKGQEVRPSPPSSQTFASALLLIWWLAGISPGFISVPPASLGHTILAQPAVYLLAAWPIKRLFNRQLPIKILLGFLLIGAVAWRDLPDYYLNWPAQGMVRFLYRADYALMADVLENDPNLTDFGVSSLLAGPWDREALAIDARSAILPRWFNPERAVLIKPALSFIGFPKPADQFGPVFKPAADPMTAGAYVLSQVEMAVPQSLSPTCFTNGLCLLSAEYDPASGRVLLAWAVAQKIDLPPTPLISNPPPPGIYAGPRLRVFAHLLDGGGQLLAGDDGLWVDPATLQPDDVFLQQHWLPFDPEAVNVALGLYDPKTGERIMTKDGRDRFEISLKD